MTESLRDRPILLTRLLELSIQLTPDGLEDLVCIAEAKAERYFNRKLIPFTVPGAQQPKKMER